MMPCSGQGLGCNKLKLGIKICTEKNFENFIKCCWYSNDENDFLHKLLLNNTQVSKLHKDFANNSAANIKLSKTQLHKIGQSGGFYVDF